MYICSYGFSVYYNIFTVAMEESMESLKNFCLHRIFTSLTSDNVVKIYRDASEKSPVLGNVTVYQTDFIADLKSIHVTSN